MTTRATILHQFTTLDRLREFPKVRPIGNLVTTSTVISVCRSSGESIILLDNAFLLFAQPASVLQGTLTAMGGVERVGIYNGVHG